MAKYINKFSNREEFNTKIFGADFPSINYITDEGLLEWIESQPPFKFIVTNLDGSIALAAAFDSGDTVLHRSEFYDLDVDGTAYGDFIIGEGVTNADDSLFFDTNPWYITKFTVNRLFIPSTFDMRVPIMEWDEELQEEVPTGEYDYCNTWKYPFGNYARNNYACGMNPREVHIAEGAQLWSLFALTPIENLDLSDFAWSGQSLADICYGLVMPLQSVRLPNNITSIDCQAFQNCVDLQSIDIPSGVTSIGDYALSNCGFSTISLPSGLTSIGQWAFYNCQQLTEITIPNGVTTIDDYAFYDCSSLTSATLSNSLSAISNSMFYGCGSLQNVNIPSGVTTIGANAFASCNSLGSVVFPSGVTSIGYGAFANVDAIDYIIFEGSTPCTLDSDSLAEGSSFPIYVPNAALNDYLSASTWSQYQQRLFGYDWRLVQDDYICEGKDKYQKEEMYEVNGGTSLGQYRKGSLIESGSTDCPSYRELEYIQTPSGEDKIFRYADDDPKLSVEMNYQPTYKYSLDITPIDFETCNCYSLIFGGNDQGSEFNTFGLFKLDNGWGDPEKCQVCRLGGYALGNNGDLSQQWGMYDDVRCKLTTYLSGATSGNGAVLIVENENMQTFSGVSTVLEDESIDYGTYNMPLLDMGDDGNESLVSSLKFHRLQVKDANDNLVYDYAPAERIEDGVLGVWETISDTFYPFPYTVFKGGYLQS